MRMPTKKKVARKKITTKTEAVKAVKDLTKKLEATNKKLDLLYGKLMSVIDEVYGYEGDILDLGDFMDRNWKELDKLEQEKLGG
jgi:hypothetical protein